MLVIADSLTSESMTNHLAKLFRIPEFKTKILKVGHRHFDGPSNISNNTLGDVPVEYFHR